MAKKSLPKKRRIFNLLKPFKPPATTWDKIYEWLINRARIIMVIAEVLVVGSFVGKVIVDIQAKNLDEQVESAQRILGQFSTTVEPEIRKIQQKSGSYTNLWNGSSGYSAILKEIHAIVPNPSEDIVIRLNGNAVTIRGGSSIEELITIESRMRKSPTFTNVTLPTLSAESSEISAGQGQYVFNAEIVGDPVRESLQ